MARQPKRPGLKRSPARRDSQEIVEAILSATAQLAHEGIEDLSVKRIAARAGVGVASIYRYFDDKRAIFATLARQYNERLLATLDEILSQNDDVERTLEAMIRAWLPADPRELALRRAIAKELPLDWAIDGLHQTHRAAIESVAMWLRGRCDSCPTDLEHRVFMVFGMMRGVVKMSLLEPQSSPPSDFLVAQLVPLCRAGLLGELATRDQD